jgi:phage shock protein A
MAQSSILGRIGQLVRANVNAIIDSAEDPERMLDQLVRDYTNNIAEAEEAVAQTIGNLRLVEEDAREARSAASEWGGKAAAASRRADELRGQNNASEGDRFDELARIALRRQISYEEQAKTLETQAAQQNELATKLKDGLNKLRAKRDELVSRAKMAHAQQQVQETMKSVSIMDPTSEINRFEERVRHQEAQVRGMEEVSASSLEEQFAALDEDEDQVEVETRLSQLKSESGAAV